MQSINGHIQENVEQGVVIVTGSYCLLHQVLCVDELTRRRHAGHLHRYRHALERAVALAHARWEVAVL